MRETNNGRRYSPEFRERAVQLLLASDKPMNTVARELGVSYPGLLKWKDSYMAQQRTQQNKARPKPADLERQLRQLQRENESLRRQRDVLKKALGILSEEPSQKGMPE